MNKLDSTLKTILSLHLTNLPTFSQLSKNFGFQYSYDKNTGYSDSSPNPNYYSINSQGLKISVHAGDKTFHNGSPTFPRSEMRGLDVICDNKDYSILFDQMISEYPSRNTEYAFAWMVPLDLMSC